MKLSKTLFRKIVSLMLAASVAVNSSAAVFAEGGETTVKHTETVTNTVSGIDLGLTDDELLLGYFENKLYGVDGGGISLFTALAGSRLTDKQQAIYDVITVAAKNIADGNTASTIIPYVNNLKIPYAELGLASDANETAINNAISEKYITKTDWDVVYKALLSDNPYNFYWHDKTTGSKYSCNWSADGSYVTLNIPFTFAPGVDYKGTEDNTVDTAKTAAASSAAEKANEIVAENAGKTSLERLTAYKDAICELVSYNNSAAGSQMSVIGTNPWQLIYVFDGDSSTNVVCEGYSKAFQYLCDLDGDLTCYSVSGNMSGGTGSGSHMWNIVTLGGKNYLVDVTNCDSGTIGAPDELFLKGMSSAGTNAYSRTISGVTITFTYYSEMSDYFSDSILTLSAEDYSAEEEETKDISSAKVTQKTALTYNGTAQTPDFTVTLDGNALTDADYTVTVTAQTNAGGYKATITGKGDYAGEIEASWTIGQLDISNAAITATPTEEAYTGGSVSATVAVTYNEKNLVQNTDYVFSTDSVNAAVNAGTYTVKIEGMGNFKGTASTTWTLAKADPVVTAPTAITGLMSNGQPHTLITAGTTTGGTMEYKLDADGEFGTALPTASEAGTYTVYYRVVGDDNYNDFTSDTPVVIEISSNVVVITDLTAGSGTGWKIEDFILYLDEGYVFDIQCTVNNWIDNNGTIINGTFNGSLSNYGTITGGTFSLVYNHGTITGGDLSDLLNYGEIIITDDSVTVTCTSEDEGTITVDGVKHTHNTTLSYPSLDDSYHEAVWKCTDCPINYEVRETVEHTIEYKGENEKITASCKCGYTAGELILSPPENLLYDGSAKEAVVTNTIPDIETPEPSYAIVGDTPLVDGKPVNVGTYQATVALNGAVISITFAIDNTVVITDITSVTEGTGWRIESDTLVLDEGYIFDIQCPVYINAKNLGTIKNGIFSSYVDNKGTITGGVFEQQVVNFGSIEGGTFNLLENAGNVIITDNSVTVTQTTIDNGTLTVDGTVHTHEYSMSYEQYSDEFHWDIAECENCPINFLAKNKDKHSLECEISGNEAHFSCVCEYEGIITISVPENAVYDGSEKTASIALDANAQELVDYGFITVSDVYYRDSDNNPMDSAPVNKGTYEAAATITIKATSTGTELRQEFRIKGKAPEASFIFAENLTYNGEEQPVVTDAQVTGGEAWYKLEGDAEYSTDIPKVTDAKTYKLFYKIVGDENHENTEPQSVTITVAPYDFSSDALVGGNNLTYSGKEQNCSMSLFWESTLLKKDIDYTLSGDLTATVPGLYTVTFTGAGNFTGTKTGTYLVTKRAITVTPDNQDIVIGYQPKSEKITADNLADGHKITVTFDEIDSSAVAEGITLTIASVTITDAENNDVTEHYDITTETGTVNIVEHTHEYSYTADGAVITATCKNTDGGCPDTAQTVTLTAPESIVYDGTEKTVTAVGTIDGVEIPGIVYANNINAGVNTASASLTIGGATAKLSFTINPKDISSAAVTVYKGIYNGLSFTPAIESVKLDETTILGETDYEVSTDEKYINAGDYTVEINGVGNYTGTATGTFTILPVNIEYVIDIYDDKSDPISLTKVYDGTNTFELPEFSSITTDSLTMENPGTDFEITLTYDDLNSGEDKSLTAVITILGDMKNNFTQESYIVPVEAKGEITPAKAVLTAAPSANTLTYNGDAQALITAGTTNDGTFMYKLGEDGEYSADIPEAKNAGTYIVYYYIAADSNHTDGTEGSVSVKISPKTVKVTVENAEKTYGESDPELTCTTDGVVAGDDLIFTVTREEGENVNEYAITAELTGGADKDNYTADITDGVFTIKKAIPSTLNIPEPVADSITYGQKLSEAKLADGWKWVDETAVPGVNDTCKAYYTVDDNNYDYSTVTGYDSDMHAIVLDAVVTIAKAPLKITADDKYIIVGADLPDVSTLTYKAETLVGSDQLITKPTLGYSGADNMTIGKYDILISGADAGENYEITYQNGTLHVDICDHSGTTTVRYDSESHWYYCTECGADNLDKAAHSGGTADCVTQAVCETCKIPYGKALGHDWADFWIQGDTHHWHNCQNGNCPITDDSKKDGYAEHTYGEWVEITAPTATEDGKKERICTVCKYSDTETIPATGSNTGGEADSPVTPPSTPSTTPSYTGRPSWVNPPAPTTTTTSGASTTTPPEDDDIDDDIDDIIDDIYEDDDSRAPQIKGENGKTGWEAISEEIADSDEGDTVIVDMNGATEVPEEIFEQIMGLDIELVIELENGFKWTINGENVTEPADIDLGVSFDADIPVKVINKITGKCAYKTITLSHNGEFGFTAVLTVDMGEKNEGLFANLYYHVNGSAEFICADKIDKNGKADLEFTHASEYIIVIDDENHGKRAEDSDVNGDTDEEIVSGDDEDGNPFTAVTLSFSGVIVSAAAVMLTKKRRK